MTTNSPYLATNNLHFKPLCARLGRGVTWTTTALQQNASPNAWHGHAMRILSKGILFAGSIMTIPLALIEAVSLFVIGGLAIAINKFICQNRSEFLQKHSLKALSYAIHSSLVTVALLVLGLKNPNLSYHTSTAIMDHAIYLGSAGFTQCVFGSVIDRAVGRDAQFAVGRTLNLLSDSHPDLINDLFLQIQRDFDLNLRDRMGEIPHLDEYLNRHPEDRDFVRNFNFQSLLSDRAYRERSLELLSRFLVDVQLVRPALGGANALMFDLNQHTAEETGYQDLHVRLLKDSFVEIYRTPDLAHCLDQGGDTGQDLLLMMDGSVFVPLTTYTQYKELLEPIQCPTRFSGNLTRYNDRRTKLIEAKALVDALSDGDKRNLVQKILRGANFEAPEAIREAYRKIVELAPALYQGPLMTKTELNLRNVEGGNIVESRNLFQGACQQAIAEINTPPAV